MLSRRSYFRLFTMAVLLIGSYAGLQADDEPPNQLDCIVGDPNHLYACKNGTIRDSPAQLQECHALCRDSSPNGCGWGGNAVHANAYNGGPENGPGCYGPNTYIIYCACSTSGGIEG